QRFGLVSDWITEDDGLAAAVIQTGQRILVRHRCRQMQHVQEGVVLAGIRVEPGPAERGPQRGGVDRDDRTQPRGFIAAEDDLLVVAGSEHVGHVVAPSRPLAAPLWEAYACAGRIGRSRRMAPSPRAGDRTTETRERSCG